MLSSWTNWSLNTGSDDDHADADDDDDDDDDDDEQDGDHSDIIARQHLIYLKRRPPSYKPGGFWSSPRHSTLISLKTQQFENK